MKSLKLVMVAIVAIGMAQVVSANQAEDCVGPLCNTGGYNMGDGFDTFGTNSPDGNYTDLPGVNVGGSGCNTPDCLPEVTLVPLHPASLSPWSFPGHFIDFQIVPPTTSDTHGNGDGSGGAQDSNNSQPLDARCLFEDTVWNPATKLYDKTGQTTYFDAGTSMMMATTSVRVTPLNQLGLASSCSTDTTYTDSTAPSAAWIFTCRQGKWYDNSVTNDHGSDVIQTGAELESNRDGVDYLVPTFIRGLATEAQVSSYQNVKKYKVGYKLTKYCAGPNNKKFAPGTQMTTRGCYEMDGSDIADTTETATSYDMNTSITDADDYVVCH